MDMADLEEFLADGQSVEEIVEYLYRTVGESRPKSLSTDRINTPMSRLRAGRPVGFIDPCQPIHRP
jgi:hypothetical protein